jgi:integral membrane sensor domain MASE1
MFMIPRTTGAWCRVYIVYPLAPAVVDTILRYVIVPPHTIWEAISFSDVSLSMGILSLFLVQAILTRSLASENDEDKQYRLGIASEFQMYTLLSFAFFIVISVFDDLDRSYHNILPSMPLNVFSYCIVIVASITIYRALYAQRTFKLVIS